MAIRWPIRQAAAWLREGGVIAYPTEAVYGLGCDPDNPEAIQRLLRIKQREPSKGLILIAADFSQLAPYLDELDEAKQQQVFASWPGPFTWLWPAKASVSKWLRGEHDTLAVRVTAHPVASQLCRAFGKALVSTSANRSGMPPVTTAGEVTETLADNIDFIVGGEVGAEQTPTQIRDARSGKVIRA